MIIAVPERARRQTAESESFSAARWEVALCRALRGRSGAAGAGGWLQKRLFIVYGASHAFGE